MSIRRNVVANFAGQGWTTLCGLALIPLFIAFLGIEAYGLVGIMALLQTWLSLLDFGLTPALSREMARFTAGAHAGSGIRSLLRAVEVPVVAIAVVIAVVIWATSGWLAQVWLHADSLSAADVAGAIGLIGLIVACRLVENMYRASLMGLQHQVAANGLSAVMATARIAGAALVLALVSQTVMAFFIWQMLIGAASALIFAIVLYRTLPAGALPAHYSLEPLRGIGRFAGGAVLVTALGFVLSQSDKVILSSLLSLSAFGVYTLAYTAASAVRLLALPIDQAVFPRLTQLHELGDQLELSDLYHRAVQYNAVLVGGVGIFVAVFGGEILRLWIPDPAVVARASSILWILVLAMILNGIMGGPYYLQLASGWTGLLVGVNGALAIAYVPAVYFLTVTYALVGAATAWLVLNIVYLFAVSSLMHRRLLRGELGEWLAVDVLAPLAAAAVVALALGALAPRGSEPLQTVIFLAVALGMILSVSTIAASRVRQDVFARLRLALARAA